MKKILILFVSAYLLAGCNVTNSREYNSSNTGNNMNDSELSNEIFTYSFGFDYSQPLIEIIYPGKFIKKDGCLLFQGRDELFTPVFPRITTKYKKGDNEIIIGSKSFEIGKMFDVSVLNPVNIRSSSFSFDTTGPDHCLMENILPIQLY